MEQLLGLGKSITSLFITLFAKGEVFAQDSSVIIDDEIGTIVIDKGPFYAQLWFWVVIGFVFLLLLIALIPGSGRKKIEKPRKDKIEEETQEEDRKIEEDKTEKED